MKKHACHVVALCFAFVTVPGCTSGKDAVTLNDNIVKAHQKLIDSREAFGKSIVPEINSDKPKLEDARRTYKEAKDTLESVKTETATWKVPSGAAAKDLLDAHHKLLRVGEKSIDEFAAVIKILEDPKIAIGERAGKIQIMLSNLGPAETAAVDELKTAQQAYAKAHNIKLIPPKK